MEQIQSLQSLTCRRTQNPRNDLLPAEMVWEIYDKSLPRRDCKRKEVAKDVQTIYSLSRLNGPCLSVITLPACNTRQSPFADDYGSARKPMGQTKRPVGVLARMLALARGQKKLKGHHT